jgi:hypothetical protein
MVLHKYQSRKEASRTGGIATRAAVLRIFGLSLMGAGMKLVLAVQNRPSQSSTRLRLGSHTKGVKEQPAGAGSFMKHPAGCTLSTH